MWRWPLNTTRAFCSMLWCFIWPRGGLFGVILRLAWYPSTGIGAAAALTQAAILVVLVSLPAKALLLVLDSLTVIRGGIPPSETHTTRPARTAIDWDQAFAELITDDHQDQGDTVTRVHGIEVGPDGLAVDPAQQYNLDQARRGDDMDRIERDRAVQAELLDRQERLMRMQQKDNQ